MSKTITAILVVGWYIVCITIGVVVIKYVHDHAALPDTGAFAPL